MTLPYDTSDIVKEVLELGADLRAGKISNPVARTLLLRAKMAFDGVRIEMEAARMGCEFSSVILDAKERTKKGTLKRVA